MLKTNNSDVNISCLTNLEQLELWQTWNETHIYPATMSIDLTRVAENIMHLLLLQIYHHEICSLNIYIGSDIFADASRLMLN